MTQPLVSIVIPSFNAGRYLLDSIESAANQTYERKQLVVIDDCSQDDSAARVAQLSKDIASRFSGGFVFLVNDRNEGAHAALNRGVGLSAGDYVFFLNDDDLFEPQRLRVMMDALLRTESKLAFSAVVCIDAQGSPCTLPLALQFERLPGRIGRHPFAAAAAAVENICVSSGNLAVKKTLFEQLGGFRGLLYIHDYDFFLRACLVSEPVFVPETAYLYRLHENNSFLRLRKRGKTENRLVWLQTYAAIQDGNVENPCMLTRPDYVADVRAAVSEYGIKKRILFDAATTPLARWTAHGLVRRLLPEAWHRKNA